MIAIYGMMKATVVPSGVHLLFFFKYFVQSFLPVLSSKPQYLWQDNFFKIKRFQLKNSLKSFNGTIYQERVCMELMSVCSVREILKLDEPSSLNTVIILSESHVLDNQI